jgi:hypothetical protein
MSERSSDQPSSPSRKFAPDVNPLENRVLLSSVNHELDIVFPRHLPRTGGIFVLSGSAVGIGVGQPQGNTVQVTDDGAGNVEAEWNGGPVHSFTSITSTVIQAERARHDQVTFHLTSSRTSPTAVAVGSHVPMNALAPSEIGLPFRLKRARTSGTAFQTGSTLTVTVNKPTTNAVQLTNEGAGAVQVEWNGGPVHSFTGVETIVVDTKNATKDQITLTDTSP